MAFGEQKKKKTAFEIVTKIVIVTMLVVTIAGVILSAVNALI